MFCVHYLRPLSMCGLFRSPFSKRVCGGGATVKETTVQGKQISTQQLTVSLMTSFRVPPSMYSVIKLSLLSLYSTPINLKTWGCSRLRITLTWNCQKNKTVLKASLPWGLNTNQTNVFPQDSGNSPIVMKYKEVIVLSLRKIHPKTVLSVENHRGAAAHYQPPLGRFSVSPHHIGSALSSPSLPLWLYESPARNSDIAQSW